MKKLIDKVDRLFKMDDKINEVLHSEDSAKGEDLGAEFESVESWSTVETKYDYFIDLFQLQSKM